MPLKKCKKEGCTRMAAKDYCSIHQKPQTTKKEPFKMEQPQVKQVAQTSQPQQRRQKKEWQPRAKTCQKCKEPKADVNELEFQCLRFKWTISKELGKRQAVCNTRENQPAEEMPEILVESAEQ